MSVLRAIRNNCNVLCRTGKGSQELAPLAGALRKRAQTVSRWHSDVIVLRRGRDARSVSWIKLTGADTMTVAAKVAEIAQQSRPDAIFIDGGGPGGGVIDRLRQLQHRVFDVQFGSKADHSHIGQDGAIVYANKRAEMWGAMRAWLAGGMIPDDRELMADLTGVEYGYALREGRDAILLEKKRYEETRACITRSCRCLGPDICLPCGGN